MCLTNKARRSGLLSGFFFRSPKPLISHLLWRPFAVAGGPTANGSHEPPAWGEPLPRGRGAQDGNWSRRWFPRWAEDQPRRRSEAADGHLSGARVRVREGSAYEGGAGEWGQVGLQRSRSALLLPSASHFRRMPWPADLSGVGNAPAEQYGSSSDSPLEGTGFEPSVPPRTERPWECHRSRSSRSPT